MSAIERARRTAAQPNDSATVLMTAFRYDVKYVKPEDVRTDVVRVWTDNLHIDDQGEAKFDWIYRRAVEPPPGVFVLFATDRGPEARIVGTAGLALRTFFAGDQPLRAGLLADLAVDRDHRTVMPALRLVRSARAAALRDCHMAYGFPNHSAEPVFLRCGYRRLGALTRWARVLRHARYVHRVVPVAALSRSAGAAIDAGTLALLAARAAPALASHRLHWLASVDERFADLWQSARRWYPLIGKRDAAFLRWRFLAQPGREFRIAALALRRAEYELRAYAVVEREGAVAHIRDLFGHPPDLGTLLDLLLVALARQGAASVSFSFLGSNRIGQLLASRGFRTRQSERAIVCDTDVARRDLAALVDDAQNWHLTEADEDT